MGRLNWFLAGTAVGTIQIFNFVYETELMKQNLQKETMVISRMKHFVSIIYLSCFIACLRS